VTTYNEQLQRIVREYQEETGLSGPISLRIVADWAIRTGRWHARPGALVRQCAEQLAIALREEYYNDPQGRRVRTKHAIRVPIREKGEQSHFWDDIRTAKREHMVLSIQQRRNGIVFDCHQLKTVVDSYNDNGNLGDPIQLVMDFTADVAEMQAGDHSVVA
jgi:hypothetical protein